MTASTPAPTTTWSSPSPWTNCSLGSGPCCVAAGFPGRATGYGLADLSLDPAARRVFRGSREVLLTKTEFDLLELLLFNARVVIPRDVIMDRIWGYGFETSSNPLEVYIGYLRRKLEASGERRLIHTVRGVGYVARER